MAKVYFHIDLNAFFANAEVLLDPSLKGKPIAIAGQSRRSVLSTASYEARKYGVHAAMPVNEALKLCPELILVEGHYHWYSELSKQFIELVEGYCDDIEQASIDECYIDVTNEIQKYPKPLDLAVKIQKEVFEQLHLTCSIGVSPNMFLAKMASDMKKPNGITVLRIRDVAEKMWPLPISEMWGIGKKTVPELEELNIHTIGDLARYEDVETLRSVFGKNTEEVIQRANGYDHREIVHEYDAKSYGVSETMLDDVTDYDEIRGLIRSLCRRLSNRLKRDEKAGKLVTLRIKYYDFTNHDRSKRLESPIFKEEDIFVQAMNIFDETWDEEAIRLLGVSVSDFVSEESYKQMDLFNQEVDKSQQIQDIMHELNKTAGQTVFMKGSSLLKDK